MPRDGTATRSKILDAAENLMERNGFAGTSLDQILAEAGSSKGAFFHHFSSKHDLAIALMGRYVEADLGQLRRALDAVREVDDPVARVLAFLGYFETWAEELISEDSACLYIAALSERDLLDAAIREVVQHGILTWRSEVAALLRAALAQRPEAPPMDPDALADHLFATFEGGFLLCRSLQSAEPMRAQLRVFRELVEAALRS
jgi:TetR/AcrR family transcriptional repressor of nem operon